MRNLVFMVAFGDRCLEEFDLIYPPILGFGNDVLLITDKNIKRKGVEVLQFSKPEETQEMYKFRVHIYRVFDFSLYDSVCYMDTDVIMRRNIFEKYNEMFFLIYTNGHFITPAIAKKLADLGNVTVAISVEGMEDLTDERRGKGAFKKVLEAFKNLREAGVPFGISVTTTTKNAELLLKEKFYDFYFNKQGVSYMWQFQLMPVGYGRRAMELTINPQQRLKLYRKWEEYMKEKKYCIADFWNSGVLSDGCLAYGKDGGYLYVNWEGNVMPCVFVPYYVDNVIDLFKKGKTLWDALQSDFFKRGRKWQEEYKKNKDNWLMPCSIRDHYKNWRENIATKDIKPENKDAEAAIKSKEYRQALEEFDDEVEKTTIPIWKKEYLEE